MTIRKISGSGTIERAATSGSRRYQGLLLAVLMVKREDQRPPIPARFSATDGYGVGDAPADGTSLPDDGRGLVHRRAEHWVCTQRVDGRPNDARLGSVDGRRGVFSTDPNSVKARNIAAHGGRLCTSRAVTTPACSKVGPAR